MEATKKELKAQQERERALRLSQPHPEAKRRLWEMLGLILLLLVIDQGSKIYVKTHMILGESIRVTDWFYILFTENPGMAFGWQLFDKMFLTVFRIIASVGIMWILVRTTRRSYPTGFLICIALIFAGAVGNIFDSIFYGVIFGHSYGQVATLFPPEGGYAGWMHGKVVDMLYFPIIKSTYPAWMPKVGGEPFVFFSPIFNFADACISVGVIALLIFYPHTFGHILNSDEEHPSEPQDQGQVNG